MIGWIDYEDTDFRDEANAFHAFSGYNALKFRNQKLDAIES